MDLLKKIPFFLLLLAVFFCLHGSVENYGYLNVYEVMEVGGIIIVCLAVSFGLIWLITKDHFFAALLTFFIALWYLFFGAIHDLIKTTSFLQFLQSYTVLLQVLLVVNILVAWWLKRSKQLYQKLFLYLNVLFIIFCVSDIVLLVSKAATYKEIAYPNPVAFDQSKVTAKPNVYFLLFDEYAGYKSLNDSFHYKNDSFYNFLKQEKFEVLPTFSNYDFTPFSMSSILNMQYVPENYNRNQLTQPDVQHRFGEIRNAQVPAIFKSMGYSIVNNSIFDIKGHPALYQSNGLFPIHAELLTNKIFHNRLLKNIGWWLVTGRFTINFLKEHYMYRKDAYNRQVEKRLLEAAATPAIKPRFWYAHFLLPHGQFYRDSSGALNSAEKILNLKYLADKSLYLSYLKYSNNIIKELVIKINTNDPNAIVIIMSDHGFYDYDNPGDYNPYNYDNICFVKAPNNNPLFYNTQLSNVNVFRHLFNNQFGQNLAYVKDSTVYVIEDPAVLR